MQPAREHLRHADQADVWTLRTERFLPHVGALAACLSETELSRADRLCAADARDRFIVERAVLRRILAARVGAYAASLDVITTARGKPALRAHADVWFSLSHSRQLTLIAVAAVPVGIDVEHPRRLRRVERTAERVLHPETVALLRAVPEPRRSLLFLDAWTLREAHVKAVGGGLFHTPDALPFDPDTAAGSGVRTVRDRAGAAEWSVAHFRPDDVARAAFVAHGSVRVLAFREWTGDSDAP